MDGHPTPTATTQDDPLQQGRSFSGGAAPIFGRTGAVIIETTLITLELLPGDVTRMCLCMQKSPVFGASQPVFNPLRGIFG
jgi:hypothetical protein